MDVKKGSAIRQKMSMFLGQLSYLPQTWRLIWNATRNWTLAWSILLVLQGLLPAGMVYLTRWFVDSLVEAIGAFSGGFWDVLQPVLLPAALMAGTMVVSDILGTAIGWVRSGQAEIIQDNLHGLIHEKSIKVDLEFYESPEYYDHLHRARSEASSRSIALLENGGSFFQNGITLLAMATVLLPYGIWLPLLLLFGTLPALYVVLQHNMRYHDWWRKTTSHRRRAHYFDFLLTNSTIAAEIRLFGLGNHFRAAFQNIRERLRHQRLNLLKSQSLAQWAAGLLAMFSAGAAMLWMLWRTLQGQFTLGDLALFYQAFNKGQSLLGALLRNLGQIYAHSLFLGNLFAFLDLEPQIADPPDPSPIPKFVRQGICFQNLTFHYPGTERPAIQNFDLMIQAGQTVAIVGTNGAGKSTLVKLICRFYDPQEGQILVDGNDLRSLPVDRLRRMITVLFQLPVPYYTSARQNIAFGDLGSKPTQEAIENAARAAGAHELIAGLPKGYDSLLGKWFSGGTELSVGEWQRVALARAYLRQAEIIILDEPTSHMDSWAEIEWFEKFRWLAQGRTSLIITHRFTTAMRADVIHVMDRGQIVESGTHDELLVHSGLYASSWHAQMQVAENS